MACARFWIRLNRRKQITDEELEKTDLSRCLNVVDLTALGIGSTLGAGAYVIAGQVAKMDAGPAVIVSFFIAAVASILAGLCYAEFGSRVPKAGSAYVYTYVTVGEFTAFIIGWNLILEYVIGSASVARTSSGYVDNLIGSGDVLINWFNSTMPMHLSGLAQYFDLFAFCITLFFTVILAVGVKESATFTKLFTGLNLCILSYVIIAGAFKDDPNNWSIPASRVKKETPADHCGNPSGCGNGGFDPYGVKGIIKGAATCFYAFVGFDAIATTGEEAKNPQKTIPMATILSLLVVFAFYTGISITITMMAPYYLLDSNAPFSVIFENVGWYVSMYIVGIGALCALSTSLLGAMFPMPRVVLSMARDGVIFRFLAKVNSRLKTPVIATLLSGALAAVMAALFDVEALVNMMSIGTLLAYTLVSSSVLLLRYEADIPVGMSFIQGHMLKSDLHSSRNFIAQLLRPSGKYPSYFSAVAVKGLTICLALWLIGLTCMLTFGGSYIFSGTPWAIAIVCVFLILSITSVFLIWLQPQNPRKLTFMVPAVPFFPALSMFFNIFLIVNLDYFTFIRFAVWMAIGFIIYFGYGFWHSSENQKAKLASIAVPSEFGLNISQSDLIENMKASDSGIFVDEKIVNGFPVSGKESL